MRYSHSLVAVVIFGFLVHAFGEASSLETRPGREVSFPKNEVRDSFFAYMLGVIATGTDFDVDNNQMREILTEFKSKIALPFDLIVRVKQSTDPLDGEKTIELDFRRKVKIPIPFSLSSYQPGGSIVCSQTLLFTVIPSTSKDPVSPEAVSPVFDLALSDDFLLVTADGWLKTVLAARHLEDTWIHHIVFFKWQGSWIGLFEGTVRGMGKEHRSYFNFTRNAIVFPVPSDLDTAGRAVLPRQDEPR
jgi:hypothetical protein